MSKADIQNIQRSLNIIRAELDQADAQTRLKALELMMATSQSAIATARKLYKPTIQRPKPLPIPKPVKPTGKPKPPNPPKPKPAKKPDLSPKQPVPPVG